jgi:hypothetical protein
MPARRTRGFAEINRVVLTAQYASPQPCCCEVSRRFFRALEVVVGHGLREARLRGISLSLMRGLGESLTGSLSLLVDGQSAFRSSVNAEAITLPRRDR